MRTTPWVSGEWNAICDQCGRKFKASALRKRWDGLMVCVEDYETRHPQEFVRGRPDNRPLPWTRPDKDLDANGNPVSSAAPSLNCSLLNFTYPPKVVLEATGTQYVRKVSVSGPLTVNGTLIIECTLEVT